MTAVNAIYKIHILQLIFVYKLQFKSNNNILFNFFPLNYDGSVFLRLLQEKPFA